MADLSQQVQLQQSINEALTARNQLLQQQNGLLSAQTDLAKQINGQVGNKNATQRVRSMSSAIREGNEALGDGADKAKELEEALGEAADAGDGLKSKFGKLGSGLKEFTGFMSSALGAASSLAGGLLSMAASVAKAAFAIFTFPFKIFSALIDLAQQGGGGRPIAEAWQEVVEVFGHLKTGPGKDVADTIRKVKTESKNLAGAGISLRNIFGYGREGTADMMKDVNELGSAMGDSFHRLGPAFKQLGSKMIIFQRGLGMTKEEFGELAGIAQSRTKDIEGYLTDFSKTAARSAKAFGIGVKDMAKGMKEFTLDVSNFGHLGPKAFAPMVAYARKLGLEIKDMAGVMTKFAGFAETTEAASKMNQQFGMNVDAMKLMAAQNPAEKVEILRKAFYKTGKDLKSMTYQQRQYLATLTGIEGKSQEAAFSLKNQGISYGDIADQSKKANKEGMSQKKVLKVLAKQIKLLIQTMSGPKVTGFFDSFVKGFETGIMRSQEFRKVMMNIRHGLRQMRQMGIRVAQVFIKFFPGIKDMLEGISEFLDPAHFTRFIRVVEPLFQKLFETQDFGSFATKAADAMNTEFGTGGSNTGLGKVMTGFLKFAEGMAATLASAIEYVFSLVREKLIPWIDGVMSDAKKEFETGRAGSMVSAIGTIIGQRLGESEVIGPILKAFEPLWNIFTNNEGEFAKMVKSFEGMWEKHKGSFLIVAEEIGAAFTKALAASIVSALAWTFGPSILLALGKMFWASISKVFTAQFWVNIGKWFKTAFLNAKKLFTGFKTTIALVRTGMITFGQFASSIGQLGAAILKPFIPIQLAIGVINGLFFAMDDNIKGVGHTVAAFGLGFLEVFTFGMGSASEAFDEYFDTNITGQKVLAEQQDNVQKHQDAWMKRNKAAYDEQINRVNSLGDALKGVGLDLDRLAVGMEGSLTATEDLALTNAKKTIDRIAAIGKAANKEIANSANVASAQSAIVSNMWDKVESETGWMLDTNARFSMIHDGIKLDNAMIAEIQQLVGAGKFEMSGDYAIMDDDAYQQHRLGIEAITHKYMEESLFNERATKQADKAIAAQQKALAGIDIEALKKIRMKAIAKGEGVSSIETIIKKRLEAAAAGEFKEGSKRRQARIDDYVNTEFKKIKDQVVSSETAADKLGELQAAQRMLNKIKALQEIPKQLEAQVKKMGKTNVADVQQNVEALVKNSMALMAGVTAGFKTYKITNISQASRDALANMQSLVFFLEPLAKAFKDLTSSFQAIKSAIAKRFFHKKYSKGYFTGRLKSVASEITSLPVLIAVGLKDLLPASAVAGPLQSFDDGSGNVSGGGPQMTMAPTEAQQKAAEMALSKDNIGKITSRLQAVASMVAPVASSLGTISGSLSKLKGVLGKWPTLNKKKMAAGGDNVGSSLLLLDRFVSHISAPMIARLAKPETAGYLRNTDNNLKILNGTLLTLKGTTKNAGAIKSSAINHFKDIGVALETGVSGFVNTVAMLEDNDPDNILVPILTQLKDFKGGVVTMNHNLPMTNIEMKVIIDSRQLGINLCKTDLMAGKGKEHLVTTSHGPIFSNPWEGK